MCLLALCPIYRVTAAPGPLHLLRLHAERPSQNFGFLPVSRRCLRERYLLVDFVRGHPFLGSFAPLLPRLLTASFSIAVLTVLPALRRRQVNALVRFPPAQAIGRRSPRSRLNLRGLGQCLALTGIEELCWEGAGWGRGETDTD